jgi:hypothetical protein
LEPWVSESPRGDHVLGLPVLNCVDRNRLDGHIADTQLSLAGNLIPFVMIARG